MDKKEQLETIDYLLNNFPFDKDWMEKFIALENAEHDPHVDPIEQNPSFVIGKHHELIYFLMERKSKLESSERTS